MENQNGSSSELHVVMFPWFGFGHISPFVQLSNKLSSHGVRISFFSASGNVQRISSSLNSRPNVEIIPLQIPAVEGLPPGVENTAEMTPAMAELLKQAVDLLQPHIESLLVSLKPQFVFHDFVQHWLPNMASKYGIKTMLMNVFSAVSGAFLTTPARMKLTGKPPTLDEMKNPPVDFPSGSSITGVKTFEALDFLYVFKSFNGPSVYDRVNACLREASGQVIKSCNEMEGQYLDHLRKEIGKPILLAGPVVPKQPTGALDDKWANWLRAFPSKSVIFCSFGSETFLSDEQIKELLLGLEQTGLPFIVVLNFPFESEKKLKSALPEGFEERVKDKAVIHTGWVQQQHILAHESVGCFVNHSGFSSVTEGLVNDCQLVLLPMKGDQYLNAKLFAGDLKVAVQVNRKDEDGSFTKEDLCKSVKVVMGGVEEEPGKSIRENHQKWKKFLLDEEVQERFVTDLVKQLKRLVYSD